MRTSLRPVAVAVALVLSSPIIAQEQAAPLPGPPDIPQEQSTPADPPAAAPEAPIVPADPPPFEEPPGPIGSLDAVASGPVVTFDSFSDSVPGRFYDAAGAQVSAADPNTLQLGLQNFTASTRYPFPRVAMDTASVMITAPRGYYIARVTYTQRGSGEIGRAAGAMGGSQWTVAGASYPLKTFATNPTVTETVDLTGQGLTRVPVTVTTTLTVFETLGLATVRLTAAEITAELLPFADGQ